MNSLREQVNWGKGDGLVPAIVQDAISGRVLMLGYMNVAALRKTLTSEYVTFFSRSRQCLWTKGETSGNKLRLVGIEIDCDGDTLLVSATPNGPTCHLGTSSCFDKVEEKPGFGFIGQLESTIANRLTTPDDDSYTTRLANAGIQRIAQKVGEEGVEVALAAVSGDREEIIGEVADLLYHVLVLLHYQDLGVIDVARLLEQRHRKKLTAQSTNTDDSGTPARV